jgi:hypothetical protein
MTIWSVKPTNKKSIIERQEYIKGDDKIIYETGWRWGEFLVTTEDDNPPDISSGVDIYSCGYESELVETSDGCWDDIDTSNCSDETSEWLDTFLEENSMFDLEENGWNYGDCEMIIDSDLIIEKVEE